VSGAMIQSKKRDASGIKAALVTSLAMLVLVGNYALAADIPAGSYKIASVSTAGVRSIGEATVLAKVRSRAGEIFDPAVATEDAKRIAELKGVRSAYYNTELKDDKVLLTFVVIEKLIVRGVAFSGNANYSDSALQKELNFKRADYLDPLMVEAGVKDLMLFYLDKGYAFVKIAADKNEMETGRVVYNIEEGPRVKVKAIKFAGNERLRSWNLNDVVKVKTRRWLIFQGHYQETEVAEDVERLRQTYLKRGFLNVKVDFSAKFTTDNEKVTVTFNIEEGPIYTVRRLDIEGNEFFKFDELTSELKLKAGETFTQEKADFDKKKLLGKFLAAGFINAVVDPNRSFQGAAQVDVHYNIIQGERFRIGQINITGNDQTQDKVIRRVLDEFDFTPGQWYNADKAEGSGEGDLEKAVRGITLTKSTVITPIDCNRPGVRNAQVSVTEGRTGSIMLGAGVGSDAGVQGQIVYEQRNFDIAAWPSSFGDFVSGNAFKGAGQIFRISLNPGTEYSMFSVSLTEPYLNDKPISMDVGASRYIRGMESYDELRTKGFVNFEERFKGGWRMGVDFRAEQVEVSSVDADAPKEISDWAGRNMLYGVRPNFGFDTTDNRFYPTKGFAFNTGYEQVAGDATFGTVDGKFRWYKTVDEDFFERKTVLATKIQAAVTSSDAPPFEKFYLGGSGSMRGFEYRGVSKRAGVNNDAVGSDWMFLANTELAVPLNSDIFSLLVFVDSGTIQTGPYRVGAGVGIQIMVPQLLGPVPMRFEFTQPLRKGEQDETREFSFSISRLF
jgi:outer membrane protein insertion porin family